MPEGMTPDARNAPDQTLRTGHAGSIIDMRRTRGGVVMTVDMDKHRLSGDPMPDGRSTRMTKPEDARLLRQPEGESRSMSTREIGPFEQYISNGLPADPLAARFYDSICVIVHPLNAIPGENEGATLLNTMEGMSVAHGMDDDQRTAFAEAMAEKIRKARREG